MNRKIIPKELLGAYYTLLTPGTQNVVFVSKVKFLDYIIRLVEMRLLGVFKRKKIVEIQLVIFPKSLFTEI